MKKAIKFLSVLIFVFVCSNIQSPKLIENFGIYRGAATNIVNIIAAASNITLVLGLVTAIAGGALGIVAISGIRGLIFAKGKKAAIVY